MAVGVTRKNEFLSGKVYWAKIIGEPRPNYNGDGREWAFEFEPDERGVAILKSHKIADRLKDKEGREKYIVLKKTEFTKDGNKNTPIRIYDADDVDWDNSKLLGNGTAVDLKVTIVDYGPGKKKGIYPAAVRVRDLVQFQSSEFGALDKELGVEKPKRDTFKQDFGLDDDLPL